MLVASASFGDPVDQARLALRTQRRSWQLDTLAAWSDRIADMATKARTIQSSGKIIEQCANELKADLDLRIAAVLKALQG